MIMSVEQQQDFLEVISKNLKKIKGLFFSQLPHNNQEDILSDCILKVADRIARKGIATNSDYIAYLFFAYRNTIYTKHKSNKRCFIDINSISPDKFAIDVEQREEKLITRLKDEVLTEEMFNYVRANYKPLEVGFFEYYHKTSLSYRQISEATKYSISHIWKINSKIEKDLKEVFNG